MLISLGNGIFKKPSDEGAELEEAELESEEYAESSDPEIADLGGTLNAYSFPTLIKTGNPFPIKIGLASGDAEKRVQDQCRQAASFESPKVLKTWPAKRIRFIELAVHNTLRARGRWREDAPAREWFDSTLDEVDIVRFIEQS
jgi:hypothetical protein